jgi:predicted TPR repeat methyltransferase
MAMKTSAPAQAELSYADALQMAISLHRDGRWDGALKLYRRLLQLQPDDANVQHFLGMLLHRRGERDEALKLIRRSLERDPTVAAWHNNLGNALLDGGHVQQAANAYERCIELDPQNVEVLNNLGCMLRGLQRTEEAEAAFRRALELKPDFADAHSNYATLLALSHRMPEALEHYSRALELQPEDPRARRLLGVVYAQSGRLEEAAAVFSEWVKDDPHNVQARHHLAAVTGQGVPERAPDAYVIDVFDKFAGSFDERLATLEYRAPGLVGEAIAARLGTAHANLEVLDAGCGTGLCAPWLVPYARRLVGIDLSTGMLEKARERGGYHELLAAELVAHLDTAASAYDLIVSADTLCYFGALDAVLASFACAMRPGGLLVFTVEAHTIEADYKLQPHGRYSHHRNYVLRLLERQGLREARTEAVVLRKEAGQGVNGWLVSAIS